MDLNIQELSDYDTDDGDDSVYDFAFEQINDDSHVDVVQVLDEGYEINIIEDFLSLKEDDKEVVDDE